MSASVIAIHTAPEFGAPSVSQQSVHAVAGAGIEGDRNYHNASADPEKEHDPGHEITLIEIEKVEAFNSEMGTAFDAAAFRRNVITRGVDLNALVGREFNVGGTVLRGNRLCEPCTTLQGYTDTRVLPGLVHKGGLRAEIVQGGVINVGDAVVVP